jgi:heptosyltransferase-2
VPALPETILVLRSNDLGDVLLATPLFDALKRRFPAARLIAGVGRWALELLEGNPNIDEVVVVDAPWGNKYASKKGAANALRFAWGSGVVRHLQTRSIDIGVDVAGTTWGSLFLVRSGAKLRLGTLGYAGGESGFHLGVPFDPNEHVARHALRFAELLGASEVPGNRPQLFLSRKEREAGEASWPSDAPAGANRKRVAIAPGAGLAEKAWPMECFRELVERLTMSGENQVVVLGGPADRELGDRVSTDRTLSLAGVQSLRQMLATTAAADIVVCNSSLMLHAASAFDKPSVVLLGPAFASASHHQRQWGYEGLSETVGAERQDGRLASVDDALAAIERTEWVGRES